jgi:uncharacterized protein (TIGR00369 family)
MTETTSLQPADPAFEDVIRASFASQGLMRTLGAQLRSVLPGRVIIELPAGDAVSQQQGLFHGGAIGAIGDVAGGYAALSLMPAGSEVVTVEYKINFVRPAKGELLRAEGQVLRAGRSVTVARIDVAAIEDGKATVVALLQATFMRVAG